MMPVIRRLVQQKIWVVLSLFVVLSTVSSVVVPPFETPDELFHYAYIQQLAAGGGLPVLEPNEEAMWHQEGGQAPGYYLAAAALTFWVDQSDFPARFQRKNPHAALGYPLTTANANYLIHDTTESWPWRGSILALHIARLFSILLAVITIWAIYRTLSMLVGECLALLGSALVAFIPQFVFISGSASNDNAITAMAALLLWQLIRLLADAPASATAPDPYQLTHPLRAPRRYLLLGLLAGLALLAKHGGVTLTALLFALLAVVAWRARSWRVLLQGGAIVGMVAMVVGGWWYLRNWWLYGDPLAMNMWFLFMGRPEPLELSSIVGELRGMEFSFWGLFGWFNVAYPVPLYTLFRIIEVTALFGVLLTAVRLGRSRALTTAARGRSWRLLGVGLLVAWFVLHLVSWFSFMQLSMAAQGRLLFPALPVFALFLGVGLGAWRLRSAQTRWLAWGVVCFLFCLSALTPWWIIRPTYQPASPVQQLPPTATPLSWQYGEVLRLEGYDLHTSQRAPGQHVALTLYWRPLRPMTTAYSLSIKGVGRDQELVAAQDAYPDSGRWATTIMAPGTIYPDRHEIPLAERATSPALLRLLLDVYDFDTQQNLAPTFTDGSTGIPLFFAEIMLRSPDDTPDPPQTWAARPESPHLTIDRDQLTLEFTWAVGQSLTTKYQTFVHLVESVGQPPLAQTDFEPLQGALPTTAWWPGDRLPEQAQLTLPVDLPPGEYLVLLGLYELETGARLEMRPGQNEWHLATLRWDGDEWVVHDAH